MKEDATGARLGDKIAAAVLDCLDSHIVVLDHRGVIVRTNRSWMRFAARNPRTDDGPARNIDVGTDYLAICSAAVGYSSESAMQAHRGISDVLKGRLREFSLEYPCHSATRQRWFEMRVTPLPRARPRQVVIVHTDISRLKLAEFEAERTSVELAELLATLEVSASRVKSLIVQEPASGADATPSPREGRQISRAWLSDAQRLRMLSSREKEVLLALSRGERLADIAARLGLSAKSVSTYRARLMDKLKVDTTAELISLVSRVGVIR